jgi:hypothetical protein
MYDNTVSTQLEQIVQYYSGTAGTVDISPYVHMRERNYPGPVVRWNSFSHSQPFLRSESATPNHSTFSLVGHFSLLHLHYIQLPAFLRNSTPSRTAGSLPLL